MPSIIAMPDAGITTPVSFDTPPTFDLWQANPEQKARREADEAKTKWFVEARGKLDGIRLDPDAWFKDKDLSFDRDPKRARLLAINTAALDMYGDGTTEIPTDDTALPRKILLQTIAARVYGVTEPITEEKFHELEVKAATQRRDIRALGNDLQGAATLEAKLERKDLKGMPAANGWQRWREAAKGKPGYDPRNEPDYFEAYQETARTVQRAVDKYRPQLDAVWKAFVAKEDYWTQAEKAYDSLPEAQREPFLAALTLRARAMPEAEQRGFWGNYRMRGTQDLGNLAGDFMDFGAVNAPFLDSQAGPGMPKPFRDASDPWVKDPMGASKEIRKSINFRNRVLEIQRQDYDPLKLVAPHGLQWAEKMAYALPGVFASSAAAVVAPAALLGSLQEMHYGSMRDRLMKSGMSEADADERANAMALPAASLEFVTERMGAQLLFGKLPFLEKSVGKALDKITSAPARFAARTAAGGLEQGMQEVLANYIPPLVQDIGYGLSMAVPDVKWTGEKGELSGFWSTENLDTFLAVLPLAVFGAAGGISRDARVKAFASASDLELTAYGIRPDTIPQLRSALAQGVGSGNLAIDEAHQTRNAESDEAAAASKEIAEAAMRRAGAAQALQSYGYSFPKIVARPDGMLAVHDFRTGEEIGTAADIPGAGRIIRAHTTALDNISDDARIALSTLLGATQKAAKTTGVETELDIGRVFNRDTAEVMGPEFVERYAHQMALVEQAEGGTGEITRNVIGLHVTEQRNGIAQLVTKIYSGGGIPTVFHEDFHVLRERARQAGTITVEDDIKLLRALDTIFAGRTTERGGKGTQARFIPEGLTDDHLRYSMIPAELIPAEFNGDAVAYRDTILSEAIGEIGEMEVFRTKKPGRGTSKLGVERGMLSAHIGAVARIDAGVAGKFRAFINAVKARWGLAMTRAYLMKNALAAGEFDATTYEAYLDKLMGLDAQKAHEERVLQGFRELLANAGVKYSLGPATAADARYLELAKNPEKNRDELQRMVDAAAEKAGYTVGYVHHGTADNITVFDEKERGRTTASASAKRGFFFAKDKTVAEGYADFARPSNIDALKRKQEQLEKQAQRIGTNEAWNQYYDAYSKYETAELSYSRDDRQPNVVTAHLSLKNPFVHDYEGNDFRDESYDEIIKRAQQAKHDGVILKNTFDGVGDPGGFRNPLTDIYVVFSPTQIKSADPITRDDAGNVIPLSQRFTKQTPDIRYALGPESPGGFNLRSRGATLYVHSHTGVLFPDGHEIKTNATAPDQVPAGGGTFWDRLRETSRRSALLDSREESADDPAFTAWLADLLDRAPGGDVTGGSVRSFWNWLKTTLNRHSRGYDPLDVMDALSGMGITGAVVSENANPDWRLHYAPIDAEETVLWADERGSYGFGRLPTADEVAQARAAHEKNPQQYPMFALGPARMAGIMSGDALARIKDPRRLAQTMARIARDFDELRVRNERLLLLSTHKQGKAELRAAAMLEEERLRDQYVGEAYARHQGIIDDADLVRIKAQPGHAMLADPMTPLRGRLMSRRRAIDLHPDMFKRNSPGDYDGAEGISRSVFGGTLMPDQAAQELYEANLIKSPTPDAMWELLHQEQALVSKMKDARTAAQADVRSAKLRAKQEANQWLASREGDQAENFSQKEEILRSLAMLDAIIAALPYELRGRLGGHTQMARITTDEAKLRYLQQKLAMADIALKGFLKEQYGAEFEKLLKRSRPEKDEEGKRPSGKIGADMHDLFRAIEAAMWLDAAGVEARVAELESLLGQENITPDQEAHINLEIGMTTLVGDWLHADAARREQALLEALRLFEGGYMGRLIEVARRRQERASGRVALKAATGKAGTAEERDAKILADNGFKGKWADGLLSLGSFDQALTYIFGEKSKLAQTLVDRERWCSQHKTDAILQKTLALEDAYTRLAGGNRVKGQQLQWAMHQKTDKVGQRTMSQLEIITATLMWRQEDGQRHMQGHLDEDGKPVGEWSYDQSWVDEAESKLDDNARAISLHLIDEYSREYDRINEVFRDLYGVNLPRHAFYSPLSVKPVHEGAGQVVDPVSGFGMQGMSMTPGSLRNRSQTAIAEPAFEDAAQLFIGHIKQMEHFIAYGKFTQDLMALVNSRDVLNAVEAKAGQAGRSALKNWVDYFAQGGNRDAGAHLGLNRILNVMTGRAASSILIGRASVIAIQTVQLGAGLAEMPTGAYLKRLAKLVTGNMGWGSALSTAYIQRRFKELPVMVRMAVDGLAATKPTHLRMAIQKLGSLIGGADAMFTAGTYAMIYDFQLGQAREMGMDDAQAQTYAHQAAERGCDRIAQPTRPGTRSLTENRSTVYTKLVWAFASESRQKLALSGFTLANPDAPLGRKARALAVTWLVGGLLVTMIRSAWRDAMDGGDDDWLDEKNWDPKKLALDALLGPLQGLPVLGDAAQSAISGMFGHWMPEGNLFSGVTQAGKALGNVKDWDDADAGEIINDVDKILGGMALGNDRMAEFSSLMHMVKDAFKLSKQVTGD